MQNSFLCYVGFFLFPINFKTVKPTCAKFLYGFLIIFFSFGNLPIELNWGIKVLNVQKLMKNDASKPIHKSWNYYYKMLNLQFPEKLVSTLSDGLFVSSPKSRTIISRLRLMVLPSTPSTWSTALLDILLFLNIQGFKEDLWKSTEYILNERQTAKPIESKY